MFRARGEIDEMYPRDTSDAAKEKHFHYVKKYLIKWFRVSLGVRFRCW